MDAPQYLAALPALLINPDFATARRQQFQERTAPLFASVRRSPAVAADSVTAAQLADFCYRETAWKRPLVEAGQYPTYLGTLKPTNATRSVLALWLGWQNALSLGLSLGVERFVVCEDDVVPRTDIATLSAPPPNSDVVFWQGALPGASFKAEDEAYRAGKPIRWITCPSETSKALMLLTAGAIEFSTRAAALWLELLKNHPAHADHSLGFLIAGLPGSCVRAYPTPLVQYGAQLRNTSRVRTPALTRPGKQQATATKKGPALDVTPLGVVQTVAITSVKPYPSNPRNIPAKAIEQTAESIRQFGWQQPLVVDADMVLVAGHTRLQAARSLGLTQVPVIIASSLTPQQVKAFRIADNRTHDYTSWDYTELIKELEGLDDEFAQVLDLADWKGIIDQFEEQQADTGLDFDEDMDAMLRGKYKMTVIFVSQEAAEKAGPTVLDIPGVVNIRYSGKPVEADLA